MEYLEPDPLPQPERSPGRRRLFTFLKISITVAGLVLVFQSLDLQSILSLIREVEIMWMAIGAILMALSLVIRAYRWHLLIKGAGSSIRFRRLVELYLVGSFFNAFLPSGLGGDIVRATEAAQDVESSVAVSTVLVDRLTGLMALFAMALLVLPFRPANFPNGLAATIVLICIGGIFSGFVLVDGRLFNLFIRAMPSKFRRMGGNFLERLATSIQHCGGSTLAGALLVSVVFNLIQVGWWASTGRALALDIPFSYYVLIVPMMSLALLVPSIGGLGVRENLAPILFNGAGISPTQAVALTLLVFGLERVASLFGAPVYLYSSLRGARRPDLPDGAPAHHDRS